MQDSKLFYLKELRIWRRDLPIQVKHSYSLQRMRAFNFNEKKGLKAS